MREHLALTKYFSTFPTPKPAPKQRSTDLRTQALLLHARGWSYRKIATALGIHWTRVGQLLA